MKTTSDYESFGAPLVDRTLTESNMKSYAWGHNATMKDDEIYGEGNTYDFENRMYDARTGRFMSEDPASNVYTFVSPYAFAANSPIMFVDEDGMFPSLPAAPPGGRKRVKIHFGQRTITRTFYLSASFLDPTSAAGAPAPVNTTVGMVMNGGVTIGGFLTNIAMNPNLQLDDVSMTLSKIGSPRHNHGNRTNPITGGGFMTGAEPPNVYNYVVGTQTYTQNTVTAPRALYPNQNLALMDPIAINFAFGAATNGSVDGCFRYSLRFDIAVQVEKQMFEHPYTPRLGGVSQAGTQLQGTIVTPSINPPTRFTRQMLKWNGSWKGDRKWFNDTYQFTNTQGTPRGPI